MGEIDHTKVVIFNAFQAGNDIGYFGHSLTISNSIFLAIVEDKTKRIKTGIENCGNVRDIFGILEDRRVYYIKPLLLRVKGNFDRKLFVISPHNLLSNNRGCQSGNTLLSINENFFAAVL